MHKYDYDQVLMDISRVVSKIGERKPYGFYTVGVLNDLSDGIEIKDFYTSEPLVKEYGVPLDLKELETTKGFGAWLLNKVIKLD